MDRMPTLQDYIKSKALLVAVLPVTVSLIFQTSSCKNVGPSLKSTD